MILMMTEKKLKAKIYDMTEYDYKMKMIVDLRWVHAVVISVHTMPSNAFTLDSRG